MKVLDRHPAAPGSAPDPNQEFALAEFSAGFVNSTSTALPHAPEYAETVLAMAQRELKQADPDLGLILREMNKIVEGDVDKQLKVLALCIAGKAAEREFPETARANLKRAAALGGHEQVKEIVAALAA